MGFIKLSHFVFIILLLVFANSFSSSPVENDVQLALLTARVDSLQAKMNQLIILLEEEKTLRSNLQAMHEDLSIESQKQRSKIEFLMSENIKQKKEILLMNNNIINNSNNNLKKQIDFQQTKKMNDDSSPRQPPSSCRQLSTIGHYLDGIYLVANPETNKIETVYCDFESSTLSETLFGSIEVKRKSVYFYVQRLHDFSAANVVVPFELEILNVGGAMNTASGIFTAPVDGIYHFEFSAMKLNDASSIYVHLQVNGVTITTSYATNQSDFLALPSINAYIRLKTGDQVWLYKTYGTLRDYFRYTQFTGQLVEEDLVLG